MGNRLSNWSYYWGRWGSLCLDNIFLSFCLGSFEFLCLCYFLGFLLFSKIILCFCLGLVIFGISIFLGLDFGSGISLSLGFGSSSICLGLSLGSDIFQSLYLGSSISLNFCLGSNLSSLGLSLQFDGSLFSFNLHSLLSFHSQILLSYLLFLNGSKFLLFFSLQSRKLGLFGFNSGCLLWIWSHFGLVYCCGLDSWFGYGGGNWNT